MVLESYPKQAVVLFRKSDLKDRTHDGANAKETKKKKKKQFMQVWKEEKEATPGLGKQYKAQTTDSTNFQGLFPPFCDAGTVPCGTARQGYWGNF